MAGRNDGQDSRVEMNNSSHTNDTSASHLLLANPSNSFNNTSYIKNHTEHDAEQDRASLNALKVAFSSLQGYHNDQAKKLFSLQRKYIRLQEFVESTYGNIDWTFLEQASQQDQSSMAQAAGAYNGPQNQEFGNTLLLMKNNQSLSKEILANEQKLKDYMKEKERLRDDVDCLAQVLDQKKAELISKDEELSKLNEKIVVLQRELEIRNNLVTENEQLRQRVELYERSGVLNERDPEKDDLRARLRNVQEECHRLHALYEEQGRKLDARDKEITRLQSQCKQFEIENSILRSQRNEGNDMTDSGTNAELEKALELVKKQSSEIKALKDAAQLQQTVIQDMLNKAKLNGAVKAGELRANQIADGQSGHYFGDEYNRQPNYPLVVRPGQDKFNDTRTVRPEMPSNTPKYSNFSPDSAYLGISKLTGQRLVAVSSPQIKESIIPTGNLNIRTMMANENRPPAVNVADSCNLDPAHNVYVDTNFKPRLRASDSDLSRFSGHDENIQRNNSSSLSPPGILTRQQDQYAYVDHGAKPKNSDKLGVPTRMTQSEVIYGNVSPKRDDASGHGSMTGSAFYPAHAGSQKLENRPVGIPEENSAKARLYNGEPDYENVFQNHETAERSTFDQREGSRAIYENFSDTIIGDRHINENRAYSGPNIDSHGNFGLNRTANENIEGGSERVNSLKICPSCNREFSRLTLDEFQLHVYECFDSNDDQPTTLQAPRNVSQEDDRTCPMCGNTFPMTVPQETYEAHVLAHFGEEQFELVNS